jgi:hypothetical protein
MQSILQHRRLQNGAKRDVGSFRAHVDSASASHHTASEINSAEEKGHQVKEHTVPGVQVSGPSEDDGSTTYQVGWADGDPENPMNWSRAKKWWVTTAVCLIAMAVSIPASIDGPVSAQFNEHYHVGAIAGSMTTGMTNLKASLDCWKLTIYAL